MDIWEANSISTQLTPHPCNVTGELACSGSGCNNLCDTSGCEFNPFRMGNETFYGPGMTVDTTKPLTVVTQFVTDDNTATGTLVAIKRFYVQDGVVIPNSMVNLPGLPSDNHAITQEYCTDKMTVLGDSTAFNQHGGLAGMGESLARSAVLVLSLWDDLSGGMGWLDGSTGSGEGGARGSCPAPPAASDPKASVTFSNIKVGDINSTFVQPAPPPPAPPSSVSSAPSGTSSAPTAVQTHWGQW